jgi:hypothetical protein
MRISEAMNLGRSMLKPRAGYHWDQQRNEGCAWGMVNIAAPGKYHYMNQSATAMQVPLPCGCKGLVMGSGCHYYDYENGISTLSLAIVHLFNYHVMTANDWTMDQLIDWLRSVEPADPEEDAENDQAAKSEATSERPSAVPILR